MTVGYEFVNNTRDHAIAWQIGIFSFVSIDISLFCYWSSGLRFNCSQFVFWHFFYSEILLNFNVVNNRYLVCHCFAAIKINFPATLKESFENCSILIA